MKKHLGIPALALIASVFGCATIHAGAQTVTGLDANGHLAPAAIASTAGFAYTRLRDGIQVRVAGMTKNVIFYGPRTIRVNTTLGENFWRHPSIVITGRPEAVSFDTRDGVGTLILASRFLQIVIDKSTGAMTFKDANGKIYTQEKQAAPQVLKQIDVAGAPSYEAQNTFTLKPDEAIYGFGFVGEGAVNRRGKNLLLVQTNIGIIIPVMMSTERYGILWDVYSKMVFKDTAEGATLWAESAPGGVDYYFIAGDSMDQVVAGYRDLTGQAPMYPKQAFGLFMSKERYETQARLVEVAKTFRKERFPLDYIVQDWQYWGSDKDGSWSGMTWDRERFPDPKAAIKTLHDMHLKLMVSIWPSVGNDTALAHELDQSKLRFEPLHWISKKARIYDAYSPEGRSIYFKHVKKGLLDVGVDALWMDGTEVEVGTAAHNPVDNEHDIKSLGSNALGDFTRYLNPYSLMTTMGTYEGQRATGKRRVFTLTRSAWAGAQRTAAASWSGDTRASWETLGQQINGGVNVTITGNPYWTQDTAGFFVPGNDFPGADKNPSYRELYARWLQYAAFNPIMRIHGTGAEREPYIFKQSDPEVYKSLRDAVDLRYRLLPYTYSLAWRVTHDGYTLMRALPMDFPDDRAVRDVDDAFLFGPSFLVHPVTRPMYRPHTPPATTIPATALRTPAGRPGLAGQYFEGRNFEIPKGTTTDTVIDFLWPPPPLADIPAGLSSLNDFSARWTGSLVAPETGEYELGLEGDDGFRLFVDGKLVVEDWRNGSKRYKSANVSLRQGQSVAVTVEYYQATVDRSLRLAWRTPSQRRALAHPARPDTTVLTYLPAGTDWYDFWTHERFSGGATVAKDVPLDTFPLYVRAGSIVPMGPVVQYATERADAPYEIRIYPGADGKFTVYEDDNETYDYEKGRYATYELTWDDAGKTLSVGPRKGAYPGMVKRRRLNVVLVGPANAAAIGTATATRSLDYVGQAATLKF